MCNRTSVCDIVTETLSACCHNLRSSNLIHTPHNPSCLVTVGRKTTDTSNFLDDLCSAKCKYGSSKSATIVFKHELCCLGGRSQKRSPCSERWRRFSPRSSSSSPKPPPSSWRKIGVSKRDKTCILEVQNQRKQTYVKSWPTTLQMQADLQMTRSRSIFTKDEPSWFSGIAKYQVGSGL